MTLQTLTTVTASEASAILSTIAQPVYPRVPHYREVEVLADSPVDTTPTVSIAQPVYPRVPHYREVEVPVASPVDATPTTSIAQPVYPRVPHYREVTVRAAANDPNVTPITSPSSQQFWG